MLLTLRMLLHQSSLAVLWVRGQARAWMDGIGAAAAHPVHLRLLLLDNVVVVDDGAVLQLDIVPVS
jgi:hypothetical protein